MYRIILPANQTPFRNSIHENENRKKYSDLARGFRGVTGMCAQADVAADGPMGVERVRHGVVMVKTAPKP